MTHLDFDSDKNAGCKPPTLPAFLLLAGSLVLGACDFVPRGHVTLFNNTDVNLETSVYRHDAVTVLSGSHVRSDVEYSRVFFTVQRGDERFIYRIPFDIWGSRHTDGWARDLRLQIEDSMRVYLAPRDRDEPIGGPPAQPRCFPLIPIGEWLHADVRIHSVEPSRRSRYMYGTVPQRIRPFLGNRQIIPLDVWVPTIWIKVLLKDVDTGYVGRALVRNYTFAQRLWWLTQGGDDLTPPPAEFIQDHYVPFMQEHQDRPIEMKVRAFGEWALGWRGLCKDDSPADPFPRQAPYTLSELGFADRGELIAALFDFDRSSGIGTQRPETIGERKFSTLDQRFISLLIDLDLVVEAGLGPGLRVRIIE